ncbi:MAG: hypothetical protein FJZ47_21945 [Candidatus Tectomicrobia bacterium]|uniref:4Fe4S-binding SPASM domain-containing protein n=1 Tax=Tectimicrobiota bacterium TaxID=2528274 RepID=A0A937W751_UNCTE|nr:hypothetical protein [Candidatus Tectomicrobia bacterium]
MRHNIHQVDEARRLARELGVDLLRFIPVGMPFDAQEKDALRRDWFPQFDETPEGMEALQYQLLQRPKKSACFYLYRSLTVNPDARVSPCCVVYGEKNDFGDLLAESHETIWNNERYRSARALFAHDGKPTVRTICDRCNIFERRVKNNPRPPSLLQVRNASL